MDFTNMIFDEKDQYIVSLERKVKILEKRLHDSKQKNREEKLKLKYDLEQKEKDIESWREKYDQAITFEYDGTSFEGLLTFAHNVRHYLLSGLRHMKSCSSCLDKTCPNDMRYKKDKNGEFAKKIVSLGNNSYMNVGYEDRPVEESRKEWGSIISKMIRALELKEKYQCRSYDMSEKEKRDVNEGMELLIKYQDEFLY